MDWIDCDNTIVYDYSDEGLEAIYKLCRTEDLQLWYGFSRSYVEAGTGRPPVVGEGLQPLAEKV